MRWMQDSLFDHQSTSFLLLFRAQDSQRALLFQPHGKPQISLQVAYGPIWKGEIEKKPRIEQMKQSRKMYPSLIQPHLRLRTIEVSIVLSPVQLGHTRLFATPRTAARQATLSITNSQSLFKLMCIESVMPSNHLILCHLLLLLPSIFPSIRVYSNGSVLLIRWPKYWSFSFSISPSNEYSGPISFRMDWLDLLAVQGTLKSLLQQHSSKASIVQCSAFFMVQLSHPYVITGKTIALTIWTFVSKVMSLLFNMYLGLS